MNLKKLLGKRVLSVLLILTLINLSPLFLRTASADSPIRIMPLGDSITNGNAIPGGYRTDLYSKYVAAGKAIDFVGSQIGGPSTLPDQNHEGHGGWKIDEIDAQVVSWLNTYDPQIVLLKIGTNDILKNYDIANAPARLSALIDKITNTKPNAKVFVASILPIDSVTYGPRAQTYNSYIPGIVSSKVSAGKNVYFVDMYQSLTVADLLDGIHPNAAGFSKMANYWYDATISHITTNIVPSGNAHTGSWSMKGTVTSSATWQNFYQTVSGVPTNTNYTASVWIKGSGLIKLRVVSPDWSTVLVQQDINASANWTQYTLPVFNTGSNTSLQYVFSDGGTVAGTFYVDDCFLGVAGSTNKLVNPGFESGNTSWGNGNTSIYSIIQSSSGPTPTPTPVPSGNAHTGTKSGQAIVSGTATWSNFYQSVNVAANTSYTASFWMKGSGKIRLRIANANWSTVLSTQEFTATSTWTQYNLTAFNTGSNTTLQFCFSDSGNVAGTLYIDDCFMGPSTNVLSNNGFELGTNNWVIGNPSIFSIQ